MNYTIEGMQEADAEEVLRIYWEGIESNLATFETELPAWEIWIAGKRPDCRIVARQPDGNLLGWAVLSPTSKREVYAGVCELTIYIDSKAQGQGVGSDLMKEIIEMSETAGIWTLVSSIFPENEGSFRLHKKFGFKEVGIRERIAFHRRSQRWQNTLVLERRSSIVGV
ncbi:MAG: N-acetyltransferase family protein [Chloroflexota bacterium]